MEIRTALVPCASYEPDDVRAAMKACLAPFGGAAALLKKGKRVLIKANLLMATSPANATTTHPAVVRALAEELKAAGAEITLADSPGGLYAKDILKRLYAVCGMAGLSDILTLSEDVSHRDIKSAAHFGSRTVPIMTPALDTDVVISLAKLKTHTLMGTTGVAKNLFGIIPGASKAVYHAKIPDRVKFAKFLNALCEYIAPDFSIIDGVEGMEGKGPSGGEKKRADLLIASLNPHAADLAASYVMGFDAKQLPMLKDAMSRGLIPDSADKLDMVCDALDGHVVGFEPPPSYSTLQNLTADASSIFARVRRSISKQYPVVTDQCVACGVCARDCPQKIIKIENKRARIGYRDCIRCYCCQELCPVHAIELGRKPK